MSSDQEFWEGVERRAERILRLPLILIPSHEDLDRKATSGSDQPLDREISERHERFVLVYARCAESVYKYARRRTANTMDAQDVVAETFLVCSRRINDLPLGKELPWLYGIARRVITKQRQSRSRSEIAQARLSVQTAIEVPDPGATDVSTALSVLSRLSEADQEVLRLSLWEDLSPAEIAMCLGISENAVYVRLHRARRRFVAEFERAADETSGHLTTAERRQVAPRVQQSAETRRKPRATR